MIGERLGNAAVRKLAGTAVGWALDPETSWKRRRTRQNLLRIVPAARGVRVSRSSLGQVPCMVATPTGAIRRPPVLYLHGGAYVLGSATAYRHLTSRLAAATGTAVWTPDYRLAPEYPFPAALDDALTAYRQLTRNGKGVLVAGDSAGSGLALALSHVARDAELPVPTALGLICPWVDLTEQAAARRAPAPREPFINARLLEEGAVAYAGREPRGHRLISPLYADMTTIPPVVLDTSADDLILADGLRLRKLLLEQCRQVDHRHYRDLWHVFHLLAGTFPVANHALSAFGERLLRAANGSLLTAHRTLKGGSPDANDRR